MRERIESKHVTKEIKSQMPVIPVEIVKERGCTFCPYYLGNYEKQPRCMMKICAWDDENERFHPVLRGLIPFYKEKMEKAEEKFLAMKKIYTTLLGMFADNLTKEEILQDDRFFCIAGYTSGGAPYGVTWEGTLNWDFPEVYPHFLSLLFYPSIS